MTLLKAFTRRTNLKRLKRVAVGLHSTLRLGLAHSTVFFKKCLVSWKIRQFVAAKRNEFMNSICGMMQGMAVGGPQAVVPKTIHVEVSVKSKMMLRLDELRSELAFFLKTIPSVENNRPFDDVMMINCKYKDDIAQLVVVDDESATGKLLRLAEYGVVHYHLYYCHFTGVPTPEYLDLGNGEEEETVAASNHWTLPNREFEELWDSLVFDIGVKEQLINYIRKMMLLADRSVKPSIINFNRMVMLHGPPGTGKTTLCKAVAHKLLMRLAHRYKHGQLVEINSHSLFSKWFSESGKLVMKMFQKLYDLVENPHSLIIVLIDEVESLAGSREKAGNEPSDSIRVVNALLTQLDQLRNFPNVLVFTTSNLIDSVDAAFLDRADIKQFVGLPSAIAIYHILRSCVLELASKDVISTMESFHTEADRLDDPRHHPTSYRLFQISKKAVGFSGRTLRKLPLMALAYFLPHSDTSTTAEFLDALDKAVDRQLQEGRDGRAAANNAGALNAPANPVQPPPQQPHNNGAMNGVGAANGMDVV